MTRTMTYLEEGGDLGLLSQLLECVHSILVVGHIVRVDGQAGNLPAHHAR
jgi:hypothetical protein